jgi:hypothetical protein
MKTNCVRCGKTFTAPDHWHLEKDRDCAPCCSACTTKVHVETRKGLNMWPDTWAGGWIWNERLSEWIRNGITVPFTFLGD